MDRASLFWANGEGGSANCRQRDAPPVRIMGGRITSSKRFAFLDEPCELKSQQSAVGARFHLKDGRQLEFQPVPCSLWRRRTGELLFAGALLALLCSLLLFGSIKAEAHRARDLRVPHRAENAAR